MFVGNNTSRKSNMEMEARVWIQDIEIEYKLCLTFYASGER